jgi:hypothetical protein
LAALWWPPLVVVLVVLSWLGVLELPPHPARARAAAIAATSIRFIGRLVS